MWWALGIALVIITLALYWRAKKKAVLAAPGAAKASGGLDALNKILTPNSGVSLRHGAEAIPVVGSFVKVAGVVGKPLNNALDKINTAQVNALKHIPVAGKYLAMPEEYAGKVAKSVNNWLGL